MKLDGLVSWQGLDLLSFRSFSISIRFVLFNDSWDGRASPFFFSLYTQCLDIQHCVYLHTPRGMDYGIWADYEL